MSTLIDRTNEYNYNLLVPL